MVKTSLFSRGRLAWVPVGVCVVLVGPGIRASAQCDPPLPPSPPPGRGVVHYSLNGQTVEASELGDFFISNVAAPDVFPADLVGDDYLFLTGMKITDEGTTYYYSQVAFHINVGGTVAFDPGSLVETAGPPPLPESITVTTTDSPVIEQGSGVALRTMARLGDGWLSATRRNETRAGVAGLRKSDYLAKHSDL